jgi:DNA-binding MarR family transcriptional regulator
MDTDILQALHRIASRIMFLENRSRFEFEGMRLFPSELHLMLMLGEDRTANVTSMAERLGITKGAVSQTLSRLVKKGILVKERDPSRKNALDLSFTPLGRRALRHAARLRESVHARHARILEQFGKDEKKIIRRFLSRVERALSQEE